MIGSVKAGRGASALALFAAMTLLLGCAADRTDFAWAPDGHHAFVHGGSGYFVIDSSGNDLGLVTRGASSATPIEVNSDLVPAPQDIIGTWMPDSTHVILEHFEAPKSWHDYAQLLGSKRAASVSKAASHLAGIIASYHANWRDFEDSSAARIWYNKSNLNDLGVAQAIYYLDQLQPRVLAPLVRQIPKSTANACHTGQQSGPERLRLDWSPPCIFELRVRGILSADDGAGRMLLRSADEVWWVVPSPNGRALAIARATSPELLEGGSSRLDVIPVDHPVGLVLVGTASSVLPAWSPDGQNLVYEEIFLPAGVEILNDTWYPGALQMRQVCTPSGDVIARPQAAESLAAVNVAASGSIAWLPDGRILFESTPMPDTPHAGYEEATLYALRREPQLSVERLIPERLASQLPDAFGFFAVSPDGKKVAIGGADGALSVFFLDTGVLVKVSDRLSGLGVAVDAAAPSWKSANELSYVVGPGDPDGSAQRAELVTWTLGGSKNAISKLWKDVDWLPRAH